MKTDPTLAGGALQFEPVHGSSGSVSVFAAQNATGRVTVFATGVSLELARHAATPFTWRMELAGVRQGITAEPLEPTGIRNYLLGPDPANWRTGIPTWARIRFQSVYPGIDVEYYGKRGEVEYDFVVLPGSDWRRIRLRFPGSGSMELDAQGDLLIHTGAQTIRQRKPVAFQRATGVPVAVSYSIRDEEVSFELGAHDPTLAVVIDPVVVYASFLGGSNSDWAYAVAADASGGAYVTGETSSTDFPVTSGVAKPYCGADMLCDAGESDAFVTKLSPDGSRIEYSTYLGGKGADFGSAIVADAAGAVYVLIKTGSASFPSTANPFSSSGGLMLVKLNPAGQIVFSIDVLTTGVRAIAADGAQNVYIAGTNYGGLPVTGGALQSTAKEMDGYLAKLDPSGSRIVYATYLGGRAMEKLTALSVTARGVVFLGGLTLSPDFPITSGSFHGRGGTFVAKIDTTTGKLVFSTMLGGLGEEVPIGIGSDASDAIYVFGNTSSVDFPLTGGATAPANPRSFAAKVDSSGGLAYGMLFAETFVTGAVGASGSVWLAGLPPPVGMDSGVMWRLIQIAPDGEVLHSSTFPHSTETHEMLKHPTSIAADAQGNVYIPWSSTLPYRSGLGRFTATPGAAQPTAASGYDGFVAKIATGSLRIEPPAVSIQTDYRDSRGLSVSYDPPGPSWLIPDVTFKSSKKWIGAHCASPLQCGLTVDARGIAPGDYSEQVVVQPSGVQHSPVVIPVKVKVTSGGQVQPPGPGEVLYGNPVFLSWNFNTPASNIVTSGTIRPPFDPQSIEYQHNAWLTVTKQDAYLVNISADPLKAPPGTSLVEITMKGAGDNPPLYKTVVRLSMPVPALQSSPAALTFLQHAKRMKTDSAEVILAFGDRLFSASRFTVSPPAESWVRVTPETGAIPGKLTISVDAIAAGSGIHRTEVRVACDGPFGTTTSIPITLKVDDKVPFTVSPPTLTFTPDEAGISKKVHVDSDAAAPYSAQSFTWDTVRVDSPTGTLPSDIAVHFTGFPEDWQQLGLDSGYLEVTAQQHRFRVPIVVGWRAFSPSINPGGIVNAAGFRPGPVAPGSIASVFGTDLGWGLIQATKSPLPFTLGQTSSTTSDHDLVPLFAVTANQVNIQVPERYVSGSAKRKLKAIVGPFESAEVEFELVPAAPGIFTWGENRAAAQDEHYASISLDNPARAGKPIIVYCTGQGQTIPQVDTGRPAPVDPLARFVFPVSAAIGGKDAKVLFAGLTPKAVGLCQVNLEVPDLPPGDHPVTITVNGVTSNAPLIAVTQ